MCIAVAYIIQDKTTKYFFQWRMSTQQYVKCKCLSFYSDFFFFFFFSPVTQYSWGLEVNCSYLSLVTGSGPTLSVESPCFMENQALSLFIDRSEATQYHIVMLVYSTSECETKEHLICLVCTSAIQDGCNQLSGWHAAVLPLYLNFLI